MIQVLHSNTIDLSSTDAIVENVSDDETIEYVSDTAVENLIDDSTGENLSECPAVENLSNIHAVENVSDETIKNVSDTPAVPSTVSSEVFYSKRRAMKRTSSVNICMTSSKRERRAPKRFE